MATLSLVIDTQSKGKFGYGIKIAVRHQSQTRFIQTGLKVDEASQFKKGRVCNHPNANYLNLKLQSLLNKYKSILLELNGVKGYSVMQLRDILLNRTKLQTMDPTFQYVANKYISELREDGRESYANLLERNCRYFSEFFSDSFPLVDITPESIRNYERYIRKTKNMNDTTINMMMSRTRTIINRGVKMGLVQYQIHPFAYRKIQASPVRELDLEVENLQKIRDCDFPQKRFIVARDLFMLSFYLGGINMADLLEIDFRDKEYIEYERKKVSSMVSGNKNIVIPFVDEAKEIAYRWMDKETGKLDFGMHFTYSNFYRYITRSLTELQEKLDIDQKVVFYSARKSFAQYASELGITDGVIDYVLGHSDKSRGVIRHYAKIKRRQAEICITRVVEYIKDPEKFEDYIEMRMDAMMVMR